jgi:hypothetical protein
MKKKCNNPFWAYLAVGVAALMFICVTLAVAQSDRGTITGTVADATGALVPGASVQITNMENGAKSSTVSTDTGNFTVPSVTAGKYEVAVTAQGFTRSVQTGIQVQVAMTVRLDVVLQVGSSTESVTVTSQAPLLRTENAEQSTNVQGDRINALPLNVGSSGAIRNPYAFVILAPGISGSGGFENGSSLGANINGLGNSNFRVLIEGQDGTSGNSVDRVNETSPSTEAIGEFTLQTSNFAAEFGQGLSAVINFTVRSGSNKFHGSAYEYFVNEALNSYTAFTHVRGVNRKHDAGGSIGGPVWIPKLYNGRDKTFFFFSFEGFRNSQRASLSLQTLPTTAFRNGDFSAALTGRVLSPATNPLGVQINENVIYDPATSRLVGGNVIRDPFNNNTIPSNRFDPVAVAIQKLIPAADQPNVLYQNWAAGQPNTRIQTIPAVKIDHMFSSAARLSFYYSKERSDQISANDSLPIPISARRDQFIYAHTTRANYDHSLTPTFLIHLGAGYLRYLNPDSSPDGVLNYDAVGLLGFKGGATNGFPRITGLSNGNYGGMSPGMGPTNANHYYNDKWTSVASATYVRGNHTFKTGGELKIDIWTDRNARGSTGILNFGSSQTGLPGISTANITLPSGTGVGMGYASFLLGLVNDASVNPYQDPQWRKKGWALYIQDTWKATRKLTIDYGLRWDLQSEGHEIWNRYSQFGPTIKNPSAGGLLGGTAYEGFGPGRCNCQFVNPYPYAIGPRFGAAYQIDSKTVARAGWGIAYSSLPGYGYITNSGILGVGFDQYVWDAPGAGDPAVVLKTGLQYNLASLLVPSLNPGIRPTAGTITAPSTMNDPNGARPSRVNQWNISLQRQVVPNLVVEAAYVGNRAIWTTANNLVQMNMLSDARLAQFGLDRRNAADRTLLAARIDSALAASRGFTLPYAGFPGNSTVRQALRPFPQFNSSLAPRWAPVGDSWYDSLQVKVTKRYSRGLELTAAYTWQKELDLNGVSNDMFNRVVQKRLNNVPQVLNIAFSYRVPRWKVNKLVSTLLGDWTASGILRYSNGGLIGTPGSANGLSNTNFQGTLMNRVAGQPLYLKDLGSHAIDPYHDLVLNPAAWAEVAPGEWGYAAAAYDEYRGMRTANEQFSLARIFRIKEGITFEVRGEFFNAFNRINWAGPSSGNPSATVTRDAKGNLTAGYGWINPSSSGNSPRNGQLVARFQF